MSLRDAAIAAYEAQTAAERASEQEQRNRFVVDARFALRPVLTARDGSLPVDPTNLDALQLVDLRWQDRLAVFTDGTVHIGVRHDDDEWTVVLVRDNDGWERVAEVESLADIGAVLRRGR